MDQYPSFDGREVHLTTRILFANPIPKCFTELSSEFQMGDGNQMELGGSSLSALFPLSNPWFARILLGPDG
jgi:hypothetical protein